MGLFCKIDAEMAAEAPTQRAKWAATYTSGTTITPRKPRPFTANRATTASTSPARHKSACSSVSRRMVSFFDQPRARRMAASFCYWRIISTGSRVPRMRAAATVRGYSV